VRHIDTAHAYGPAVANEIVADAVAEVGSHDIDGLVIATKVGVTRGPSGSFDAAARPSELREQVEANLKTLRRERLDLVYLRLGGDGLLESGGTPFGESLDALIALQDEGLISHLGLSGATTSQLAEAIERTPIAAVQNRFYLGDLSSADVLAECEDRGIAFVPYFPLGAGTLTTPDGQDPLSDIAKAHGATKAQVALAWLLAHSPAIRLIPGTSQVKHLEENLGAVEITLADAECEVLTSLAGRP
jgi:aryl-alcohol dehydrogenase-like predicted oxidoreductase